MWPFLFRLGVVATLGISVGLGIIALIAQQQEAPYARIPAPEPKVRKRKNDKKKNDEESQRQLLEDQLNSGTAVCIICTDNISRMDKIWSCPYCWNILHLKCISKWALESSYAKDTYSCPMCRKNVNHCNYPLVYRCLCGRVTNPVNMDGITPHCCGQLCKRNCEELCHPGSCRESD